MEVIYDEKLIFRSTLIGLLILVITAGPAFLLLIIKKGYSLFNTFYAVFLGLYLLFVISYAINTYFCEAFFLKIMGGKRIEDNIIKISTSVSLVMTGIFLFFFWLIEYIGLFNLACLFAFNFIIFQENKFLLSKDYIILGSRIVGVGYIKAYAIEGETKILGLKRRKINLHLKNNKILRYSGDPEGVLLLERFLQKNNIEMMLN